VALSSDDVHRVLEHMDADHREASLAIVRAHGYPAATSAEMTGVDEHGGTWHVTVGTTEASVRVTWPDGPVADSEGVRRAVVGLYRGAAG
jgi:putative heme iron utilization protein